MGKIGIFVERYNITNSEEMNALMRFAQVARKLGHWTDFLFRPDMYKIPQYDAVFIRALTDPLNSAYVAARTAEIHGVKVIDDPDSIYICCDKINMYRHLLKAGVPIPQTVFLREKDLTHARGKELLKELGKPLVLKAPNTSFSLYVEKVDSVEEFVKIGKRFFRRADQIVVQRFTKSTFDWRVGILNGEVLYVCQYTFPRKQWKIHTYTADGKELYGPVKGVAIDKADPKLLEIARDAARAIGNGLYGIDLKQTNGGYVVIEVNDNPTINAGEEDQAAGSLYEKIINYLMDKK